MNKLGAVVASTVGIFAGFVAGYVSNIWAWYLFVFFLLFNLDNYDILNLLNQWIKNSINYYNLEYYSHRKNSPYFYYRFGLALSVLL